jgi:hypothetical protein
MQLPYTRSPPHELYTTAEVQSLGGGQLSVLNEMHREYKPEFLTCNHERAPLLYLVLYSFLEG